MSRCFIVAAAPRVDLGGGPPFPTPPERGGVGGCGLGGLWEGLSPPSPIYSSYRHFTSINVKKIKGGGERAWGGPPGGQFWGSAPPHFDWGGAQTDATVRLGGQGQVWGGGRSLGGADELGVGGAPPGTPKFPPPPWGLFRLLLGQAWELRLDPTREGGGKMIWGGSRGSGGGSRGRGGSP